MGWPPWDKVQAAEPSSFLIATEPWVLLGGSCIGITLGWGGEEETTFLSLQEKTSFDLSRVSSPMLRVWQLATALVVMGDKAQNERAPSAPAQRLDLFSFNFCSFCCGQSFQYSSEILLAIFRLTKRRRCGKCCRGIFLNSPSLRLPWHFVGMYI